MVVAAHYLILRRTRFVTAADPLSIRFDRDVLDRLRRRAAGIPGASPSGLVQRLVDEGLRMAEHPGVVFRDGPGGRRPALKVGPDIWELVKFLREIDERGELATDAASEVFAIPAIAVCAGVAYYTSYPDEIDAWIADADAVSERAEQAWRRQHELLG